MAFNDIEIASTFGGVDSAALVDDAQASHHVLRAMAMQANRLTVQGHTMLCLVWTIFNDAGVTIEEDPGVLDV